MNHPTSDIQFLAQIILKVRDGDQVTVAEGTRLTAIAEVGHSTVESHTGSPAAHLDSLPEGVPAEHPDATRLVPEQRGQI
jgi:hypothetical protein